MGVLSILRKWWPELQAWWLDRHRGYSVADVESVRAKLDEARQSDPGAITWLTDREMRALREAKLGRR